MNLLDAFMKNLDFKKSCNGKPIMAYEKQNLKRDMSSLNKR